jgi:hypothetical protein
VSPIPATETGPINRGNGRFEADLPYKTFFCGIMAGLKTDLPYKPIPATETGPINRKNGRNK